jgi:transposase InsO family protein
VWTLEECEDRPRILIRDNDRKFAGGHDRVFRSEGVRVIRTPIQAPNANAYAERRIRTVREECLNHLLILNEKHLCRVLQSFIETYNTARPHQGFTGRQTARRVRSSAETYSVSSVTTTAALIRPPSARPEQSRRGIPPSGP